MQREDFDLGAEVKAISENPKIGAVATFTGLVREVAMTLEHYPGMTERAIEKIVDEAKSRWQVIDCAVIHRHGALQPNDQIVMVAVASGHRGITGPPTIRLRVQSFFISHHPWLGAETSTWLWATK